MTETMITRSELTKADIRETAERLGFDLSDVRELLAALNVPMQAEPNPLPTKPGSVIIATEVRGVKGEWRMFCDTDGDWFSVELIDNREYHDPEDITAWTEARVVPAAAPVTLTEDQVGEEWNKHRGTWVFAWGTYSTAIQEAVTATVNAALTQYAAPAEGEPIDPHDVRVGDRVRVEYTDGDVWEVEVSATRRDWIRTATDLHIYHEIIRTVHLLHREEA